MLLPATPFNIGIETVGGVMTDLIPLRTIIMHTKKSLVFTTDQDQQSTATIKVCGGKRSLTKDCHELGRFDPSGIPPAPRSVPQTEVKLEIDANGIRHVIAEDKATKNKQYITLTNMGYLSQEEIERMVKEAEEFAEERIDFREQVRNLHLQHEEHHQRQRQARGQD